MAKKVTFSPSQLAILCYQMSLVFKSGISLVEGISLLSTEMEDPKLQEVLANVNKELAGAVRIYEAFEMQNAFPDYMIRMIQIGELSGGLDEVMEHLSEYYEKIDHLNKRLQNAVTYPLLLMALMIVIIGILFVKVLPMFRDILQSIGGDMPRITSYVMSISDGLKSNGLIILIILGALFVGLGIYFKSPSGKIQSDVLKLKLPVIKKTYTKIYAAKFSETMALLLKNGISYSESLLMVSKVVDNSILEGKILSYQKLVVTGEDDENSFKEIGIFPNLLVRMIKIGYKTGELDHMMAKVSKIYETEVDRELNRLTSTVEPILIIVLSLVVGVILLTVMLPLINIMSSIGS